MSTGSSSQFDMNHWLLRFLAFVIDSIIIGIPAWIIYAFVISPFLWPSTYLGYVYLYGGAPWWGSLLLIFVIGILQLFYFAILDTAWGATVGKRVLGLQVQMVNGSKVTFDKAFIRNISKIYWLFLLTSILICLNTSTASAPSTGVLG
jgi:uncharacterized RDD family membrane protein YckC